jgi:hypothetical protein
LNFSIHAPGFGNDLSHAGYQLNATYGSASAAKTSRDPHACQIGAALERPQFDSVGGLACPLGPRKATISLISTEMSETATSWPKVFSDARQQS